MGNFWFSWNVLIKIFRFLLAFLPYYKTKFDVSLSDMSIYSILKDLKISRKRVRNKIIIKTYYKE